jgi:hypothetical protein
MSDIGKLSNDGIDETKSTKEEGSARRHHTRFRPLEDEASNRPKSEIASGTDHSSGNESRRQRIQEWQEAVPHGASPDIKTRNLRTLINDLKILYTKYTNIKAQHYNSSQRSDQQSNTLKHEFDELKNAAGIHDHDWPQYPLKIAYEILRIYEIADKKLDFIIENNATNSIETDEVLDVNRRLNIMAGKILEDKDNQEGIPESILQKLRQV